MCSGGRACLYGACLLQTADSYRRPFAQQKDSRMVVGPVSRVKLSIEGQKLASKDWTSKSDPMACLYAVDNTTGAETVCDDVFVVHTHTRTHKHAHAHTHTRSHTHTHTHTYTHIHTHNHAHKHTHTHTQLIGHTEWIKDNYDPKFQTHIECEYHFEKKQKLVFRVMDVDNPKDPMKGMSDTNKQECSYVQLLRSRNESSATLMSKNS